MSEDLDSFFAKRKTKASKKKGAIRLDDVAQTMEYNLKFGSDEAEIQSVSGKREPDLLAKQEEDSEWIAYDQKPALPLETVGVFNYNEQVEQNYIAEERQQQAERAKTWQKAESEPAKEETPPSVATAALDALKTPSVPASVPYRPPNARAGGYQAPVKRPVYKLDIENEEMFPSLGMADNIVKEEKVQQQAQKQKEAPSSEISTTKQQEEAVSKAGSPENKQLEEPSHQPKPNETKPAHLQTQDRHSGSNQRYDYDRPSSIQRHGGGSREFDRSWQPHQHWAQAPPRNAPEPTNWRTEARPVAPPSRDSRPPPRDSHPSRDAYSSRQHEPAEISQNWRKEEPKSLPLQTEKAWHAKESKPATTEVVDAGGEGWETVSSGRNRRVGGTSNITRPQDNPRQCPPKSGTYVPPQRR